MKLDGGNLPIETIYRSHNKKLKLRKIMYKI